MNKNLSKKKMSSLLGILGLVVMVAVANAQRATPTNPGGTVERAVIEGMRAKNEVAGGKIRFFNQLCVVGSLARRMPAWSNGEVPEFDSR